VLCIIIYSWKWSSEPMSEVVLGFNSSGSDNKSSILNWKPVRSVLPILLLRAFGGISAVGLVESPVTKTSSPMFDVERYEVTSSSRV
jgi:hypothetical protein